ncbi:MAG: hypothetical protein AAFV53_38030, partial [Myxococcota bacterium]
GAADAAVKAWALIPDTPQNKNLKHQAISLAGWRFNHREQTDALKDALIHALGVAGANKTISNYQFTAATDLGRAGFKGDDRVFVYLRRVSVNAEYPHNWRMTAVETLGSMADLRAVESLLNIAGYDEQGQRIPRENVNWQETALELKALEALGQMSRSPLARAFFQALADGTRRRDSRFVTASVKGLGYFGDHPDLAGPALTLLVGVNTSRQYGLSREVINAIAELWRRSDDAEVKRDAVDALLERLDSNDNRDSELSYDLLKEATTDDDLRPSLSLYRRKRNNKYTNEAVDKLARGSDAAALFELIREGRQERYSNDRIAKLVLGLMSRTPRPVTDALEALKRDIEKETSWTLNESLDLLAAGAEDMDEAGRGYIVDCTRMLRASWADARDLLARGHRAKAQRMKELEPTWERLLAICGVLSIGQDELSAALLEQDAPIDLQKKALLSLEGSETMPTEAMQTLFRDGQRQLRPLIASAMSDSAQRATLIGDAATEAGNLFLLTDDGGTETTTALRAEATNGSVLAIQSLSRLGDVAGLIALLDAHASSVGSDPVAANDQTAIRLLRALGTTGLAAAEAKLATVGRDEHFDPALRRLAWNVRRRSQRIRARREKHTAEMS